VLSLADVQLENGYTKIANEILEHLALTKLSPIQYRLIFVIWRYTYGFNRKEHTLSLSFLSKATNYDQRQLQRELTKLEERKIIIQKVQKGRPRIISFNKNYDEWLCEDIIGNSTVGKATIGNPTKEEIKNINKNINKDDDRDDVMKSNPFVEFENAFGYLPPPLLINEFNDWIDNSQFREPEEIICEVIKRARMQMPRNPSSYVSKILKELHRLELFSLDAVREYNENFDQKIKQRTGKVRATETERVGRDIPDGFVFDMNAGEDWP